MRVRTILILMALIINCRSSYRNLLSGYFVSTCYIQRLPGAVLKLEKEYSFEYQLAYLDEKIVGTWKLRGDTLILTSESFSKGNGQEMVPKHKYTNYSIYEDAYLYKNGKLYIVDNSNNISKSCFLINEKLIH